jgi:hypothetical protein
MLRSRNILLVYAVPFVALDAEGMPAAAVRFDPPAGRRNEVHFVGCVPVRTVLEKRKPGTGRQTLYATTFRYDLSPQRIPHTDYHVQRIRRGELLAADAATAKRAGVPFVPPPVAFEQAKQAAIASWTQQYGEPPPVERWPALALVMPPEDDTPPTAPAHGASMRARGVTTAVAGAPEPTPAAVVPAGAATAGAATETARPGPIPPGEPAERVA